MNSSTEKDAELGSDKVSGFTQDLEHIRNIPLLQGLDYDCQKLLAMVCRRIVFRAGDALTTAGEEAEFGYYLLSGKAQVIYRTEDVSHHIRFCDEGDFIGSYSLLGKVRHIFTIKAEIETIALRLARNDFHKVMDKFPEGMASICEQLIDRVIFWDEMLLDSHDPDDVKSSFGGVGVSLI